MLEHLEKEQGMLLLQDIREHSKRSIISLPMYPSKQSYGKHKNKFGPHRSIWKEEELAQFGKVLKFEDFNKQGKKEERVFLVEIKGT